MKKDNFFVDLTPELIEKAQKKLDFIFEEGCTKNGICESIDPKVKPSWYDEERFKRGQFFYQKHYTAGINSTIVGLLVFLQLPIGLAPLLSTGRSKNLVKLFTRYFDTLLYIDEWYHTDPFDADSKSCKTLALVRGMHMNANKKMNEKISVYEFAKKVLKEDNPDIKDEEIVSYIRSKDRVWVSMYDMILIQWSFLGCLVLEPIASGLHGANKEVVEDLMYVWKVISYKLGINEKYSIVEECDYDLFYVFCKLILEQEYILHMENVSAPTGIRMSQGVLVTFKDIFIGANCNVFLKYWYKILNVNSYKLNRTKYEHDKIQFFKVSKKNQLTEVEKQQMLKNGYNDKYVVFDHTVPFEEFELNGFKERLLYSCYLFLINTLLKYDFFKRITKNVIRNSMIKTKANRQEKVNELEKVVDKRYEFAECPFTGSITSNDAPNF